MSVMILAAGRGERMRPLTDHTPKPLLQVSGKLLLQWHLEALSQAGFQSVAINVAYLGSQIEQFVGDGSRWDLHVRFSREPEGALETAGGIARARPWCLERAQLSANQSHDAQTPQAEEPARSPFLVINADIWTDWPRAQAFEIAQEMEGSKALAHIVLVDNPPHHPQGDFEFDGRRLTFSGIGIYRPALFSSIQPGQRAALAPLLRQAMAAGQCTASHYRGKWSDIGTPERLNEINAALSEPK